MIASAIINSQKQNHVHIGRNWFTKKKNVYKTAGVSKRKSFDKLMVKLCRLFIYEIVMGIILIFMVFDVNLIGRNCFICFFFLLYYLELNIIYLFVLESELYSGFSLFNYSISLFGDEALSFYIFIYNENYGDEDNCCICN